MTPKVNYGFSSDESSIRSVDSNPDPEGKKLRQKIGKKLEISCFEMLDVLF
jgi:hypothetical protein